jgi:hypothetical protein
MISNTLSPRRPTRLQRSLRPFGVIGTWLFLIEDRVKFYRDVYFLWVKRTVGMMLRTKNYFETQKFLLNYIEIGEREPL